MDLGQYLYNYCHNASRIKTAVVMEIPCHKHGYSPIATVREFHKPSKSFKTMRPLALCHLFDGFEDYELLGDYA